MCFSLYDLWKVLDNLKLITNMDSVPSPQTNDTIDDICYSGIFIVLYTFPPCQALTLGLTEEKINAHGGICASKYIPYKALWMICGKRRFDREKNAEPEARIERTGKHCIGLVKENTRHPEPAADENAENKKKAAQNGMNF